MGAKKMGQDGPQIFSFGFHQDSDAIKKDREARKRGREELG